MNRKDLYLCEDYSVYGLGEENPFCNWGGSLEPVDVCPACGQKTFKTPCAVTGCSLFFQLGRNLRIRNTGSSMMAGQEGHVENADIADLFYFILKTYAEVL